MARIRKRPLAPPLPDRAILLQLMGIPAQRNISVEVTPKTAQANWPKVMERLASHPEEANKNHDSHKFGAGTSNRDPDALLWALQNEATPLTVECLRAFIQAYPDVVTQPRSPVITYVMNNSTLMAPENENQGGTNSTILETLLQANPKYLSGPGRTRTFQLLGFPVSSLEDAPNNFYAEARGGGHEVDWQALETHLREHPEEASILCPEDARTDDTCFLVFPLEAALRFEASPVPLRTVELLLTLCPEAATIADSSTLLLACACRHQVDPQVIRLILNANPAMAAEANPYLIDTLHERGLPLHEVVKKTSSVVAAEMAADLITAYPASVSDTSNIYGQIPLQVAVEQRELSPALLRVLLENGHRYLADDAGSSIDDTGNLQKEGHLFFKGDPHISGDDEPPMITILNEANLIRDLDRMTEIPPRYRLELDRVWQNLCLALQAAGAFRTKMSPDTMWEYPLLHGVIEFGVQQLYFDRILRECATGDLTQLDPLGRTALAVALEMADALRQKYEEDDDNMKLDVVLQMLLDDRRGGSSALASIPIADGRTLPLHRALQQGLQDGLVPIAAAFPDALAIPDPATNLIPCILSAVGDGARVGTIFALMAQRPNLIADLCQTNAVNS